MQKRKERTEEKADEEPGNAGELRSIVADAKAVAAQEETEFRKRTASAGQKTAVELSVPQPKPRPKSFAGPDTSVETRPRTNSKTQRKSSRGTSFEGEFIPPPPLDSEDYPTSDEQSPRVSDDMVYFQ